MDNALRLQYLEAMGIDVWVPRVHLESDSNIFYEPLDIIEQLDSQPVASAVPCDVCDLQAQTLVGVGNQQADWLLVVEATSTDDSMQDQSFENNAGLLFIEMLRAIDLSYEEVFIVPLVECKALNQPSSSDNQTEYCAGHLISQQQFIQPKIIVAVGEKAAQALLKTREPLTSLSGRRHYFNKTPVVVVEHPAHLLRSLLEKRKAWQDLCFAKQILNNEG